MSDSRPVILPSIAEPSPPDASAAGAPVADASAAGSRPDRPWTAIDSAAGPAEATDAPLFPGMPGEFREPTGPRARRRALLADSPLAEGRRFGGPPGLVGVMYGGLRAVLLLPIRPGAVPASARWSLLLILLILAVAIYGDALLLNDQASRFNWVALRESGLDYAFTVLASAWLVERAASRPADRGPAFRDPADAGDPTNRTQRGAGAESPLAAVAVPTRSAADAATEGQPAVDAAAAGAAASAREPAPPMHFATVVLAASFWIMLFGYAVAIFLDRRVAAGLDAPIPGLWFFTIIVVWPWWVAVRAVQMLHRYRPIPRVRRIVTLAGLLLLVGWALLDPGEPFWVAPEPLDADTYATEARAVAIPAPTSGLAAVEGRHGPSILPD